MRANKGENAMLIIFTADDAQPIVDAARIAGIYKGATLTFNPETPHDTPLLVAILPRAANIINPPDGLDTHNATVWTWDGSCLARRITTKADAERVFASPDACVPCQQIGASCGGTSGKNCHDTLAAMSIYANAVLAERRAANA